MVAGTLRAHLRLTHPPYGGRALSAPGPVQHTGRVTDLLAFSADLPVESVPAGEVLITEGSQPDRMLVLVSGEVVVEHDGVPFARIDTPGAVFGAMSAVLERPATATVRAVSDLRVHVIVKQQFADAAGHVGLVDQILDTLVHHQGPTARTGSARDPEGDHDHDHSPLGDAGSAQAEGL